VLTLTCDTADSCLQHQHADGMLHVGVLKHAVLVSDTLNTMMCCTPPQVRGQDIPSPVKTWAHCGINVKVLEVLKKYGYDKPLPIQAQVGGTDRVQTGRHACLLRCVLGKCLMTAGLETLRPAQAHVVGLQAARVRVTGRSSRRSVSQPDMQWLTMLCFLSKHTHTHIHPAMLSV
jgi:hypothetical protein